VVGDIEEGAAGGRGGNLYQLHVRLLGGPPGFMAVAFYTGADDVFPGVLPSPIARYHVVEGKVAALLSAVLAGVFIAVEDFIAGHLAHAAGSSNELGEADDGGKLDGVGERVDVPEAVLNHLRFALPDEDDGAAGAADGERLVALV